MIIILEQYIEDKWDERSWQLALSSEKPVEAYLKSVEERRLAKSAVSIDDMPKEQQDWLRST